MTLKRMAYAGGSIILVLFAASVLFLGNQRLALAWELGDPMPDPETLTQEEICLIFEILEANGMSFPGFECDDEGEGEEGEGGGEIPMNQCQNGIDDDLDGAIDWPADEGCVNNGDNDESDGGSGGGGGGGEEDPTPAELCVADGGTWTETEGGRCEFQLTVTDVGPGVTNLLGETSHATGSLVTLTPDPAENASFSGFSGACAGTVPCTITMNGDKTVTATYVCNEGYHASGTSCEADTSGGGDGGGGDTGGSAPTSGGGGGGGGGNGPIVGSIGTSGGSVLGAATAPMTPIPGLQCDKFLTAFIKPGGANDPEQVTRLQTVLKVFEGAAVEPNGTYDEATIDAVHTFQTKYAADILHPWGISKSTGFVYLTTRKKVNEIYCANVAFPLTPEEQAEVEGAHADATPVPPVSVQPKPEERTNPEPQTDTEDTDAEADAGAETEETPVNSTWNSLRNFFRGLLNRGR